MKTKTGKEDFQNMRWNIMKTLKELKKSGSKDLKGIKIGKNKLKV